MAPRTMRDIGKALGKVVGVSEWIIVQRGERRVWRSFGSGNASGQGTDRSTRVIVFRDTQRGRGAASFWLEDNETRAQIADKATAAASDADRGVGPSWALPPIAAPARVTVADPAITAEPEHEIDQVALAIERALGRDHRLARATLAAAIIDHAVATSTGFSSQFTATQLDVELAIAARGDRAGPVEALVRRARRRRDLGIAPAVAGARRRLRDRTSAAGLAAGRYDLVLVEDAIVADAASRAPYAWFAPVVAQAAGAAARQGLTLYQPGQSIFGGQAAIGDPISIASDGALDHGVYSRPFGTLSEPVRRFPLVRDGVAVGLALDIKEAALRAENPNGGVRNLVVTPGSTDAAALIRTSTALEVVELAWLDVDDRTGAALAEIRLAYTRTADQRRPVTGGVVSGNVFDWLARARLSRETLARGWYRGPRAIAIPGVDVT